MNINKLIKLIRSPCLIIGIIFLMQFLSGCLPTSQLDKTDSTPHLYEEIQSEGITVESTSSTGDLLPSEESFTPVGLNPDDNLNMYSSPTLDAQIISIIPASGTEIKIFGEPVILEDIPWVLAEYRQIQGWVDKNHLAIQKGEIPEELIKQGQYVLAALRRYDYILLADLIHPDYCLRFSPYPYLNENNLSFCPQDLPESANTSELYLWGRYDGTGDPIKMTFQAYHQDFVYDADYLNAEMIGFDVELSSGNAINNIPDLYPDGLTIEYYFSGFDPQYGGMDWRSLRLVFIKDSNNWYLAAIVHGEWTI